MRGWIPVTSLRVSFPPVVLGARVLVVDHHDSYTWNVVHLVAGVTGRLPDVVQHDEPTALTAIQRYTHVILSPGPGHPDNTKDFALGKAVFDCGVPVLGICLGMQALVTCFGGRVVPIEPAHGEVATVHHSDVGVFRGVESPFSAVRYHSLAATLIPDCLEVTAMTGSVVMAVRHRELALEGVQFHPESIASSHGRRLMHNFLS